MDRFRTVINDRVSKHVLTLQDKILTVGSCFSDAIGNKLQIYKVPTLVNPFGTIYNPLSIHKALQYGVVNELPAEHTYVQNNDIHLNHDFHSTFSSLDKSTLLSNLRDTIGRVHTFLKEASFIIITYGTAWVYELSRSGEIVANCHKLPSKNFTKFLLTQKKILESFDDFYNVIKSFNPKIKILLTVSPVRHIKDTLEGNCVSKSILRVSCHTLQETYNDVEYFPAYEIMLDDLRDYRFYKADKIHPSEEAEEYIWERFTEQHVSDETRSFFNQWRNVLTALHHKPFLPESSAHQQFLRDTLRKLEELKPMINVEKEIDFVNKQIL